MHNYFFFFFFFFFHFPHCKMTKLKVIYNNWNELQQRYYKATLDNLLNNKITTDNNLLQMDFNALYKTIKVPRQIVRAFIKQVALDVLKQERLGLYAIDRANSDINEQASNVVYLLSGIESLDAMLVQGFQFGHVIEFCGESIKGKIKLISHLLVSYTSTYPNDGVHVFDSTGMLEPKPMGGKLIEREGSDDLSSLLTQIECIQTFSLQNLLHSLENLAALLSSAQEYPYLIIIDDPSKLIGQHWTTSSVTNLIRIIRVLSRKMDCCIVILHHISLDTLVSSNSTERFNEIWNPAIDMRLNFIDQENDTIVQTVNGSQNENIQDSCHI
ncbi:MAG: hypothetical protein EXX96DRAFT_283366 [Benjaminiella poitrasii]|nr:MAG: hypothetical protein EXX96DRAFT_283366 [Benjaminiella poitrasii]